MSVTGYVNRSNQKTFVLTTYDKINISSAQPKFTFGKAKRFPTIKPTNCPVISYEQQKQLGNRAPGFGYGGRVTFDGVDRKLYFSLITYSVRVSGSPSPDRYKLKSQFDAPKDHTISPGKNSDLSSARKTYCFGAGRNHFNKTVVNTNTMYPDGENPGPGTYTDGSLLIGVNARKHTLKERKFYLDEA